MTDQYPNERPGHLDVDAVSAFVDRDFGPDDLAVIAFHLYECPACHREVLEIKATVLLLAALPQYAPRRSFCLGQEHARRAAAGGLRAGGSAPAWPAAPGLSGTVPGPARYGAWLPGLQTMAVAMGVLLLLVTMGDMLGVPGATQQGFFVTPTAMAATISAVDEVTAPAALEQAAPKAPASVMRTADSESDGTTDADSASQGVSAPKVQAPTPTAASSAVAAIPPPTSVAGDAAPAPPVASEPNEAAPSAASPSRLRLVQLALAVVLGWLVVTIVGLRRVRALS